MKRPLVIAHRGDVTCHRENSLAALRSAWQHFGAIETDIRMTSNGVLVLHHDAGIVVNGNSMLISAYTHEGLHEASGEWLPTLHGLLHVIRSRPRKDGLIVLEVKSDDLAVDTIDLMLSCVNEVFACADSLVSCHCQIVVTTNDLEALQSASDYINQQGSAAQYMGVGFTVYDLRDISVALRFQTLFPQGFISVSRHFHTILVSLFREQALVYTVNNVRKAQSYFDYGVAGVFTDCVEDIVAARDAWLQQQ